MRTRLSQSDRRAAILAAARSVFAERGYGASEMEDIRRRCEISRGGLYHHFANKRAILDAVIEAEVAVLAGCLEGPGAHPILRLLTAGSVHLGAGPGVLESMQSPGDRRDYLAGLEQAMAQVLSPVLGAALAGKTRPDVPPGHVAELFLTINTHINRREILGGWSAAQSAAFAATALRALLPLLREDAGLQEAAARLAERGDGA